MEIDILKRKRRSLSLKIKDYVLKNKNAYDLVVKYNEMTNELINFGRKVTIQKDYLKLENWTPDGYRLTIQPRSKSSKPAIKKGMESKNNRKKPINVNPGQNSFILYLAWTEMGGSSEPIQLQKVRDYFEEICLPMISTETHEINNTIEHILKYEFNGTEDAFRLLKLCTQFVLDAFAQTDFDRFNIAIFGKKKVC